MDVELHRPDKLVILTLISQIKINEVKWETILKLLAPLRIDKIRNCWFRNDDWSIYSRVDGEQSHRISYHIFTGKKPSSNLEICHHCDRKGCFNPEHLFEGTHSDNMKDAIKKGRLHHTIFKPKFRPINKEVLTLSKNERLEKIRKHIIETKIRKRIEPSIRIKNVLRVKITNKSIESMEPDWDIDWSKLTME